MTMVASVKSLAPDPHETYAILKNGVGKWECTCPAYKFTKPDAKGRKFPCKHLRAAWTFGQKLKKDGQPAGFDGNAIVIFDSSKF